MHGDWMNFSPSFSNLIPCFSPPTFYLAFFTIVDDKLIKGKFILTFPPLNLTWGNPACPLLSPIT